MPRKPSKYMTRELLIQASNAGTIWNYNRQISEAIAKVPEGRYPILFVMDHNHRHGVPCETHKRVQIDVLGKPVYCDMTKQFYRLLPNLVEPAAEPDTMPILQRLHEILEAQGPLTTSDLVAAYRQLYGRQGTDEKINTVGELLQWIHVSAGGPASKADAKGIRSARAKAGWRERKMKIAGSDSGISAWKPKR